MGFLHSQCCAFCLDFLDLMKAPKLFCQLQFFEVNIKPSISASMETAFPKLSLQNEKETNNSNVGLLWTQHIMTQSNKDHVSRRLGA